MNKITLRAMAVCMAVMLFVMTSCHREGCPGKITEVETPTTQTC